jgi:hypothetical protein
LLQLDLYLVSAGPRFRLDPMLFTVRQNEKASLGPGVLDGDHQESFDQFL